MEVIALFIQILAYVLFAAVLIRVVLSWTGFDPSNPIYQVLHEITEPILSPIRQFMPRAGMIDFSPMIAGFLLIIIAQAAGQLV